MNEETIDGLVSGEQNRPTFLTVLCVMTFIVSGYNFITSLINIFVSNALDSSSLNSMTDQLNEAMEEMDSQGQAFMGQFIDAIQITIASILENAVMLGVLEMLVSALGILGAVLMFKLNKKGYYLYILAKIIGVIAPLVIIGVNILTGSIYSFVAFIGIVFIVLYGLNTKFMR